MRLNFVPWLTRAFSQVVQPMIQVEVFIRVKRLAEPAEPIKAV
jgi:hypothetical protein